MPGVPAIPTGARVVRRSGLVDRTRLALGRVDGAAHAGPDSAKFQFGEEVSVQPAPATAEFTAELSELAPAATAAVAIEFADPEEPEPDDPDVLDAEREDAGERSVGPPLRPEPTCEGAEEETCGKAPEPDVAGADASAGVATPAAGSGDPDRGVVDPAADLEAADPDATDPDATDPDATGLEADGVAALDPAGASTPKDRRIAGIADTVLPGT